MKHFAVIGNPIEHSLSPVLHNWVFEKLGLKARFKKILVPGHDLPLVVDRLRAKKLNGISVTIPHKQAIIPHLDKLDEHAERIGAVNCVALQNGKLIGHNTDWVGFSSTLKENGIKPDVNRFIILGAGGAARSILYTLLHNNAATIRIVNRTRERAVQLVENLKEVNSTDCISITTLEDIPEDELKQAIIINCTSVGLAPKADLSPIPKKFLFSDQKLIDVIYTPLKTQFLKFGGEVGAFTVNGLNMLIYQGLAALDIWFGKPLANRVDVSELETYLEERI